MAVSVLPKAFRLKSISKTETLGATSAGSSGYAYFTMTGSGITDANKIVSMIITTPNVSAKDGTQYTPLYYSVNDKRLYFEYYSPKATVAINTATATIWYIE